jgi:hypothetical protein
MINKFENICDVHNGMMSMFLAEGHQGGQTM